MSFTQSEEAKKRGVCCTRKEAKAAYEAFPYSKKQAAINYLRSWIDKDDNRLIREAIAKDPDNWIAPYHFYFGMATRNALRCAGFGEEYWPIHNLDCIYVWLIEKAVEDMDNAGSTVHTLGCTCGFCAAGFTRM